MEIQLNKVYNCDCRELMRSMVAAGIKVDSVITDPPYLINYKTNYRQNKEHKFCKAIQNDDYPQLIIEIMPLLYDVMKDNTPLYMFCGSDKVDFFKQEVEKFFTVKNLIVWDKGNRTAGDLNAQYAKCYEFIIYANKGRAPFIDGKRRLDDIWRFPRVSGTEQIHQNQKPINLLIQIINQHTKPGDTILDPFMGSFTTAVCAYKSGRNFIGAELDKEYYELGQKRLEKEMRQISFFD